MNTGYIIYQAERTRTGAEQREIDRLNSELAAAVTGSWHRLGAALANGARSVRSAGRQERVPGRTGEPRPFCQNASNVACGVRLTLPAPTFVSERTVAFSRRLN